MRRLRARASADDGIATIQNAVLFPVVMLLLLAILQGGIYYYAQNVARTAANSAVQVARTTTGTADAGQREASATIAQAGSALRDVRVGVDRGPNTATVTVTGTAMSLIPGMHLPISHTATGPVERFTEESQ
jgi:Flp pilus assembly protein TadG